MKLKLVHFSFSKLEEIELCVGEAVEKKFSYLDISHQKNLQFTQYWHKILENGSGKQNWSRVILQLLTQQGDVDAKGKVQ